MSIFSLFTHKRALESHQFSNDLLSLFHGILLCKHVGVCLPPFQITQNTEPSKKQQQVGSSEKKKKLISEDSSRYLSYLYVWDWQTRCMIRM